MDIKQKTYQLIDDLKAVCHNYGMGNDGNEYKVITQIFLYKFLNDKFGYEIKRKSTAISSAEKWELAYAEMSEEDRLDLLDSLSPDIMRLNPEHLISNLWNQQAKGDFDLIFDSTMVDIADKNIDIFSTQTTKNTKIPLFEKLTNYVTDDAQRAPFARALIDKLVNFSFEEAFAESYDFFAGIFEYLIKDYNTNGGGVYAEYYTPHAIAVIMARLLVGNNEGLHNIECYDPAAGTGTLLMALAHQIGEDKCTIFAQDRSQKSNKMLKLNLILNGLVSSLDHAVQGDTLTDPFHKSDDGQTLRQFDYIVCNPPFKLNFEETRESLAAMTSRFWAGVPKVPNVKKESMAIYTCFIQHLLNSLKGTGKGAIVLPTGFLTAKSGVEGKILKHIVKEQIVYGVISMPSNVFANTGTNVSVVFFDNSKSSDGVILIDASKLGEEYQEGSIKKVRLTEEEINLIVDTFTQKKTVEDFSIRVSYEDLKKKNCSLSASQYFDIEVDYEELSEHDFIRTMNDYSNIHRALFQKWRDLIYHNQGKRMFDYWFVQFDFPDAQGKPYKSSGGPMEWNEEMKREVPAGWKVGNLYEIADYVNGLACQKYRPISEDHKLPVIKITEMHEGYSKNTEYVRDDIDESHIIETGDILFSWSASLEVSIWNNERGGLNQHIFKVIPKVESKDYVFLQLEAYVINFIRMAEARKTTMGHITTDHLSQSRIAIPPKELLVRFQEEMDALFNLNSVYSSEDGSLEFLKKYLLKEV